MKDMNEMDCPRDNDDITGNILLFKKENQFSSDQHNYNSIL